MVSSENGKFDPFETFPSPKLPSAPTSAFPVISIDVSLPAMDIPRTLEAAAATAKNRLELWSDVISELQMTAVIEVGVFRGDFAHHILHGCPKIRQYFMIDPWRHLDDWNKPTNKSDIEFEQIKKEAIQKTAFAEDRRIVLQGKTSEVSGEIAQNSVDFAYIDGDHTLRGISIDLPCICPKLRDGGILAGDDFCPSLWQHSTQFEPTFVYPMAVHFAEALGYIIYGLPFNQFAIIVSRSSSSSFAFRDLTGKYKSTAVRDLLQM
jgi:hypothetical protein